MAAASFHFWFEIHSAVGKTQDLPLGRCCLIMSYQVFCYILENWIFPNNEHSIEIKQIYLYHLALSHFIELWRFLRTPVISNFRAQILTCKIKLWTKKVHSLKAKRLYLSVSCKTFWSHCNESKPKIILRLFLTFALRILSAHNLWRHLARPRARAYWKHGGRALILSSVSWKCL